MTAATMTEASRLLLKGRTYGLCAQLFSPDLSLPVRNQVLEELRGNLERLGYPEALGHLKRAQDVCLSDAASADGEYVRLFVKGEVLPYETTYGGTKSALGGKMQQMADIAGFYRAFGFQAAGERPDHLVPELEFTALLYVKEAYARMTGSAEGALVCADSRGKFVSEHLLSWLSEFGQRVSEAARHPAFPALAALLVSVLQADQSEVADDGARSRDLYDEKGEQE